MAKRNVISHPYQPGKDVKISQTGTIMICLPESRKLPGILSLTPAIT
jgi:hypothetical protein